METAITVVAMVFGVVWFLTRFMDNVTRIRIEAMRQSCGRRGDELVCSVTSVDETGCQGTIRRVDGKAFFRG